jgi:hypothetical protein
MHELLNGLMGQLQTFPEGEESQFFLNQVIFYACSKSSKEK